MKTLNSRGFGEYARIIDTYNGVVRVYESSADPLDKVWVNIDSQLDIFIGHAKVKRLYALDENVIACHWSAVPPGYVPVKAEASAHLNREQARILRDALDAFLKDQDEKDAR
jgi:hypothetical protein